MLSKKIIAVFTENEEEHLNTHWKKLNVKVVNVCAVTLYRMNSGSYSCYKSCKSA